MKLVPLENVLLRYTKEKDLLMNSKSLQLKKGSMVNIVGENPNIFINSLIKEYQTNSSEKILFIDNNSNFPFSNLENVDILYLPQLVPYKHPYS